MDRLSGKNVSFGASPIRCCRRCRTTWRRPRQRSPEFASPGGPASRASRYPPSAAILTGAGATPTPVFFCRGILDDCANRCVPVSRSARRTHTSVLSFPTCRFFSSKRHVDLISRTIRLRSASLVPSPSLLKLPRRAHRLGLVVCLDHRWGLWRFRPIEFVARLHACTLIITAPCLAIDFRAVMPLAVGTRLELAKLFLARACYGEQEHKQAHQ